MGRSKDALKRLVKATTGKTKDGNKPEEKPTVVTPKDGKTRKG